MQPARSYADIPLIPWQWGWLGRILLGTLNVLIGEQGIGKSFLGADLVARVTNGDDMPDGTTGFGDPGNVLMVTPEDDQSRTMGYRLRAAGADLTRVYDFTEEMIDGWVTALKREMLRIGNVRLIWIDPLSAVSPVSLTSANKTVRRQVLKPLEDMLREYAEETGVQAAIIAIVHTTKKGKQAQGSNAIMEVTRMALRVYREKTDKLVRLVHVEKSNNYDDTLADIGYTIIGKAPHGRVEYFEPDPEAVPDDGRSTPLRERISNLLAGSEPMTAAQIWEVLVRDDPELKPGAVRTNLTRLGKRPYSGVYSLGDGRWTSRRDDGPILGLGTVRLIPDDEL